nr:hypothetical protein GCM10020092_067350 [Actinoplanes digitatis]
MAVPFLLTTLARRGLLRPAPPTDVVRQLSVLRRWGFGLAGELRQAAARDPGRLAVVDERDALTYRELLDRAERLARALRDTAGVRPGDRVGLLCRNSVGMIETLVAVTSLGADPVLINTGLSGHQLVAVARDQELRTLIHDDGFAPPDGVDGIGEASRAALIDKAPPGPLGPPEREGRTIVLTSGTTGVPKGALRRTPGGFGPLCSMIDRIPLRAGERVLIAAPLFHTWGYAGLQIALALRATVVLRRKFDPDDALAAMVRHECTALVAVPVMLQQLMEVALAGTRPPLRVVAVSGSALPGGLATRFMDRYGDVLYNLYGSTEVSWASIATPADLRAAPNTAGWPPHGTRVAVLDAAGCPGAVRRVRAAVRRQRDALRGLHQRPVPGGPRRPAGHRRPRPPGRGRAGLRRRPRGRHDRLRRGERVPVRGREPARRPAPGPRGGRDRGRRRRVRQPAGGVSGASPRRGAHPGRGPRSRAWSPGSFLRTPGCGVSAAAAAERDREGADPRPAPAAQLPRPDGGTTG